VALLKQIVITFVTWLLSQLTVLLYKMEELRTVNNIVLMMLQEILHNASHAIK
jgi:hypothetical protein